MLPEFALRFLFGPPHEFPRARLLLGAVFGVISGAALYLGLMHNIAMTTIQRLIVGYVFVGVCVLGGMFSSRFRCSVLLMFPSIIGSQGRTYLMLFVIFGLYQDLQIKHSKVMWSVTMDPFVEVVQEIVDSTEELQNDAHNITSSFQGIRDEVLSNYGYANATQNTTGNSTQEAFVAKTMMRCDYVVDQGIERCKAWFGGKWQECMDWVLLPLINYLLCLPMKFDFLCNVMTVLTPWCREEVPVEGNFGQTFDKLSASIDQLGAEFHTSMTLQQVEQQSMFSLSTLQEDFSSELRRVFEEKRAVVERLLELLHLIFSFAFIAVFINAFGYCRQYNQDIRFDNLYITTYFRQIDDRRREAGKRYLLPLKKAEQKHLIEPWSIAIHPSELKLVVVGLLQVLSLSLFAGVLLALDWLIYHIFDIIQKHSFTEYSLTSEQHIDIDVGGDSIIANLLRKTIGAFNSSASVDMQTSNQHCLPQPQALSWDQYLWSVAPLVVMAIMCCVQVYTNRLRRVIAAFYFTKREKKRILFLYNMHIKKRIMFVNIQRRKLMTTRRPQTSSFLVLMERLMEHLGVRLRWCCVCGERQKGGRGCVLVCAACGVAYCTQCWRDLDQLCCACTPLKQLQGTDCGDDNDDVYYSD
ncbi:E3 ubiquitin-protein ligase DCST1 isoform X2 [Engraulis encrasicolus]|uniref:E3 ubiquitin-protein ligase DCST1 isoform X2 n=1 Tax=Engraulis encrasicolus TaxID=184585 RepID=UPI002FD5C51A